MYSAVSRFKSFSLRPPSACISALEEGERAEREPAGHFVSLTASSSTLLLERRKRKDEIVTDRDVGLKSLLLAYTQPARQQHFLYGLSAARRHRASSIISILKTILCLLSLLRRLAASLEQFYFCCVENYTTRRRRRKMVFKKKRKLCPLASRTQSRAAPIPTLPDGLYTKKSIEIYFHV